jgi:hypothetical protein
MLKQYLRNVFIATDQWINAVILGGDPDWTISSRLGRNYKDTWMCKVVDFLFSWQKREGSTSHCENASYWESDDGSEAIIAKSKDKNIG